MRMLAGSWTVDRTTTAAPGADDFVELHDTPQSGGKDDDEKSHQSEQTPERMFGWLWNVFSHREEGC